MTVWMFISCGSCGSDKLSSSRICGFIPSVGELWDCSNPPTALYALHWCCLISRHFFRHCWIYLFIFGGLTHNERQAANFKGAAWRLGWHWWMDLGSIFKHHNVFQWERLIALRHQRYWTLPHHLTHYCSVKYAIIQYRQHVHTMSLSLSLKRVYFKYVVYILHLWQNSCASLLFVRIITHYIKYFTWQFPFTVPPDSLNIVIHCSYVGFSI